MMQISKEGMSFLKMREGCKLEPYNDSSMYATIGYGHLIAKRPVNLADRANFKNFTQTQADALFVKDLTPFINIAQRAISYPLISQNQFDAFISILYNVGPGIPKIADGIIVLKSGKPSTLLQCLNVGDINGAADAFLSWNKSCGVVVAGLSNRRAMERELFLRSTQAASNGTA